MMNDRYIYRAKRIDSGEWVEGNLISDEHNPNICFIGYLFAMDESGNVHDTDIAKVDPSTICQYTQSGRCTLDENKIWENDIVACGKYRGVVKFGLYNSKHLGFYIEWIKGYEYLKKDFSYWIPRIKVIGNIFDSQELLEVEE